MGGKGSGGKTGGKKGKDDSGKKGGNKGKHNQGDGKTGGVKTGGKKGKDDGSHKQPSSAPPGSAGSASVSFAPVSWLKKAEGSSFQDRNSRVHRLVRPSAMQCPTCQRLRYRKEWRPSQWVRYAVVTEDYFQCKVCDGEAPDWHDGSGAGLPTASSPGHDSRQRPISSPTLPLDLETLPVEFRAALGNQDEVVDARNIIRRLEGFIPDWMAGLARNTWKHFSNCGALVSRGVAPVHYRCPQDGGLDFDPGNYIYSLAFNMMLPTVAAENNWNAKTKKGTS